MDIEADLRGLFAAWIRSIEERDVSFVDRFMAPEFHYTHVTGDIFDLAGYRKLYKSLAEDGGTSVRGVEDFSVLPLGGGTAALVTFDFHVDHAYADGTVEHEDNRVLMVWEKRRGRWQAVAVQATGKNSADRREEQE